MWHVRNVPATALSLLSLKPQQYLQVSADFAYAAWKTAMHAVCLTTCMYVLPGMPLHFLGEVQYGR